MATAGKDDTSGNNEATNLAKAKFLELSTTASNEESLSSLGSQLGEEESSSTDYPFDEEVKETRQGHNEGKTGVPPLGKCIASIGEFGTNKSIGDDWSFDNDDAEPTTTNTTSSHTALHVQASLVTSPSHLIQTEPKESEVEYDAIEQVSKLLGEMAMILDESICSSSAQTTPIQTPPRHCRRQGSSIDSPLSTSPAPSSSPNYPKIPVKLSLLRQMACINSDLRDGSIGDDAAALVGGNILIETIERLLAERTEMIQEVLALLEATREERVRFEI